MLKSRAGGTFCPGAPGDGQTSHLSSAHLTVVLTSDFWLALLWIASARKRNTSGGAVTVARTKGCGWEEADCQVQPYRPPVGWSLYLPVFWAWLSHLLNGSSTCYVFSRHFMCTISLSFMITSRDVFLLSHLNRDWPCVSFSWVQGRMGWEWYSLGSWIVRQGVFCSTQIFPGCSAEDQCMRCREGILQI